MSIAARLPRTITEQVRAFRMENADLEMIDMRRSGSLELGIGANQVSANPFAPPTDFPMQIERLEGPIVGREIPVHHGPTGFRFFLDGAQKTLPVTRAGLVPISVALSTAGILERDERGEAQLAARAMRENQTWLFPLRTSSPELDRWQEWLSDRGADIRDPLLGAKTDGDYQQLASHYGRLIELSQRMSGNLRALLEYDLLDMWRYELGPEYPDHWLIVDGTLRRYSSNMIGLVKSFQMQHFIGEEAVALFELPQGYRTTAFRELADVHEVEDDIYNGPVEKGERPTMWYQRFWDASGLDARHGLVRIEAPPEVNTTAQIDELASWLMTERLPRPTMDPRWPTLLYPIHFLEEILKRRLAGMTTGWPS
ncbi:MAG TPA: hypothetical protein VFQ54_10625 [Thermomicrobiales bacterium]|nr:hypothetical protein [Thermomicrobiales bacterium]